jgi:ABC-type multidrug transport system ATPase subunit
LVDGTMVSEPGYTGSQWRLHYSVSLPALNCDEVIVTTHYMDEAERCHELMYIANGRVLTRGTPAHIMAQAGGASLEEVFIRLIDQADAQKARKVSV